MKKIIVITVVFMIAFSSYAFAGAVACASTVSGKSLYGSRTTTAATASSPLIGKLSNNVFAGWNTNDTGTGYTLVTGHTSGSKLYGSAHDSTSIYSNDTFNATQAVGTNGSSYFGSGWTAL